MCGIAGKIYLGSGIIEERDLILMSNKIVHRGPDDQGIYISQDRKRAWHTADWQLLIYQHLDTSP